MERKRKIFVALGIAVGSVALVAGTLAVLNSSFAQKNYIAARLSERGIDAQFRELHFGWLFSDKFSARGAKLAFPNGEILKIEQFDAHHDGLAKIFAGEPSFRKISCKNLTLDDAHGRRKLALSVFADEAGADFKTVPTPSENEKFSRGTTRPFRLHAKNFRAETVPAAEIGTVPVAAGPTEKISFAAGTTAPESRGAKTLVAGSIDGDFVGVEPLSFVGEIRGDLAALLAQPIFSRFNNVAAGTFLLRGEGRKAQLKLDGLRSRVGNFEVATMNLSLKRDAAKTRDGDATATLGAEIFGRKKRKSSAEVRFSHLEISADGAEILGELRAKTLYAADLAQACLYFRGASELSASARAVNVLSGDVSGAANAVPAPRDASANAVSANVASAKSDVPAENAATEIASAETVPAETVPAKTAAAETVPAKIAFVETVSADASGAAAGADASPRVAFWRGFRGRLDFAVEKVILANNELGAHRGVVSVDDTSLALESASASFYGGTVRSAWRLDFSRVAPNYRFAAENSGAGVELHRFVPALRSRKNAPLEGKFDFSVDLSAAASAPSLLANTLVAEFSAKNSAPGRVRIFRADDKKIRLAGNLVRLGGSLAKMLGSVAGGIDSRAERLSESFEILQKTLSDFAFSKLELEGEFRAGEALVCRRVELCGDELRVHGNGRLRPVDGKKLGRWPVKISAKAEARGELGDAFDALGVSRGNGPVSGAAARDKFRFVRDFSFTGTLDGASDDFWKSVRDAVAGKDSRGARD